ncbi:AraC family transcriptional regulator [Mixta mediterraneensis]|uniref:AraC family transcriptional regulator n=1 Tax=Mixta mediterraneensis TaxID=2758443 RepID=UPI0018769BA1|nr:AraC family transcriptional regulator [Mixta mediterraneensis]MBE5253061.1 AraC family transcriptional regulator [Mixta mediterraneensis]
MKQTTQNWLDLRHDKPSGIESLRAHFTGHAYDPHWHDSYLIGVTEQGVQQFHSRRQQHQSRPGTVFMLEPEELHDGDAINAQGFTYRMLYLSPQQVKQRLAPLTESGVQQHELGFAATLRDDKQLAYAVWHAFEALWHDHPEMIKDAALDRLFLQLGQHPLWRNRNYMIDKDVLLAQRARDWLIAHHTENPGLQTMAQALNIDRFRLSRLFQTHWGLPPHAWLVQWRLCQARRQLAAGCAPVNVAAELGFADQSHLGRWFKRACHLTPARYQLACTNLPDSD